MIKIWIDDIRTPPSEDWIWIKSVNEAKRYISMIYTYGVTDIMLSVDHDAGDYAKDGGDYIKILDYLEMVGYNGDLRIHSMNPVGVQNMRNIIQKNGWREIYL